MNGKSWKTTLAGISMILTGITGAIAIATGQVEFSMTALTAVVGSIGGGLGLIFAKDKDVTGVPQDGSAEKPAAR